jgi:ATP-dependent Lon protease
VRVDNVPCDFILIGAMNAADMASVLPPLRNRIIGDGYEVLLNTTMPDTEENRKKLIQFAAQEIIKDGKIPHMDSSGLEALLAEARERARAIDEKPNALTLRMRGLSGLIKLAGDLAVLDGSPFITAKHVRQAREKALTIEEQLSSRYDQWWKAGMSDYGMRKPARRESEVA